jgi:hypothetical protein
MPMPAHSEQATACVKRIALVVSTADCGKSAAGMVQGFAKTTCHEGLLLRPSMPEVKNKIIAQLIA